MESEQILPTISHSIKKFPLSKKTNQKGKSFFFVRHGEREDHVKMETSSFRDSPSQADINSKYESYGEEKNTQLTDIGRFQGYKTGLFLGKILKELLKNDDNKSVLILSSPYIRCMDTSLNIVEGLCSNGINIHKKTIFLTSWVKEVQRNNSKMTFNDLENEASEWIGKNYKMQKSLINFARSAYQEPEPFLNGYKEESISDSYHRAKIFMSNQASFENETNDNHDQFSGYNGNYVICLTHAFFLKRIEMLTGEIMFGYPKINYCAITSIKFKKKEGNVKEYDETKVEEKTVQWGLKNYEIKIGMKYYSDHLFPNMSNIKYESNMRDKDLIDKPINKKYPKF